MNRTLRTLTIALLLATTAGCLGASDADPDTATEAHPETTPPGTAGATPATAAQTEPDATTAPRLQVTPPAGPLQDSAWTAEGTVSGAARITFRLVDGDVATDLGGLDAEGAWSLEIPVPYGQSLLVVTADDGAGTASAEVPLVRLAEALLQVRYGGYPGHTDSDDSVWLDVDAFPSAPLYEEAGTQHPSHANVHDLMVQWETDAGHEVTYGYSQSFGFSVDAVDGAGNPLTTSAPPWWCYVVDGEAAEMGITLQPFEPGMTVTWTLGTCA